MNDIPEKLDPHAAQALIMERLLGEAKKKDKPKVDDVTKAGKLLVKFFTQMAHDKISPDLTIEFEGHDSQQFSEWHQSLNPVSGFISFSRAESQPAAPFISLDIDTITILSESALGGDSSTIVSGDNNREMTGFERDFLEYFALLGSSTLAEFLDFELPIAKSFEVSKFDASVVNWEKVAVLNFKIDFGTVSSNFSLALPLAMVLSAIDAHQDEDDEAQSAPAPSPITAKDLERTPIRAQAAIPLPSTTLGDLDLLEIGDVITIPTANLSQAKISTRGLDVFQAQIGRCGDNYSFRIVTAIEDNDADPMNKIMNSLAGAHGTKGKYK